jgi:peptidoglycan glycosyltransferase
MKENSWRDFQSQYIIKKRKKNLFLKTTRALTALVVLLILISGILTVSVRIFKSTDPPENTLGGKKTVTQAAQTKKSTGNQDTLSKSQLNTILTGTGFIKSDENVFFTKTPEANLKITTSIDSNLQGYLLNVMKRLKTLTRGKPQRIAFVAMEANTGKIIAMTGFDLDKPDANPCIESNYPAASIFKIVTASAAVESLNYNPSTQLYFNGNKYTLYKRQLTDKKNKYSYKISFSSAFAESVNPIFGKIGKNYLGKKKLEKYAGTFGFNKQVDSELSFPSGSFATNEKDYHLAELGCGFNTDTKISPVFAAMLTSAVVNRGKIMLPFIVEHVSNPDGKILYQNKKSVWRTAIKPETASTMMKLMQKTIVSGTARKSFRGASKDSVLSKLSIGGKTGSLYNKAHTVKYDWFTGFGKDKKTNKTIVVSVVVGHRKYIGTRATSYARMILKQYFKNNSSKKT